jgi:hypothetical protein
MLRKAYMFRFIILIILVSSCIDIFDPPISTNKIFLVFEGGITNEPGPYKISIRHSHVYNSQQAYDPEINATCEIIDDSNSSEAMSELSPGIYYTKNAGFTGQTGRTYYLHIITSDGREFRSKPEKLLPSKPIDTLYIQTKTNEYIQTNLGGDNTTIADQGFEIYLDINGHSTQGAYYKFDGITTMQYSVFYRVGINPYLTYCWQSRTLNTDILVLETSSMQEDIYTGFAMSFITKDKSQYQFLTNRYGAGIPYQVSLMGWINRIRQYSISEDYYLFLEKLRNQLSAQDRIFDPAIDQVVGNITCINKPSEVVLGYFSVSSVSERSIYFYYATNKFSQKILENTPNIPPDGYTDFDPPSFWIEP